MNSLGCIEINPWFSRAETPDNPDYCVIDLDPDKHTYDQVVEAARITKDILDAIDVPSYPKTSGSPACTSISRWPPNIPTSKASSSPTSL